MIVNQFLVKFFPQPTVFFRMNAYPNRSRKRLRHLTPAFAEKKGQMP
jgi:hypothetical protein